MVLTKTGLHEWLRLRLTADQLTKFDRLANDLQVNRSAAVRELIRSRGSFRSASSTHRQAERWLGGTQ